MEKKNILFFLFTSLLLIETAINWFQWDFADFCSIIFMTKNISVIICRSDTVIIYMNDRFDGYFVIEKWMLEESTKIRKEYKQARLLVLHGSRCGCVIISYYHNGWQDNLKGIMFKIKFIRDLCEPRFQDTFYFEHTEILMIFIGAKYLLCFPRVFMHRM